MKPVLGLAALLILVAIVASASCFFTGMLMQHRPSTDVRTGHQWVHDELHITPEQDKAIESTERRFAERSKTLIDGIHRAKMELAEAMLADKAYSPRVQEAVAKINQEQGELQKATLDHVFEMAAVLSPDQAAKLLNLTANALQSSPE